MQFPRWRCAPLGAALLAAAPMAAQKPFGQFPRAIKLPIPAELFHQSKGGPAR